VGSAPVIGFIVPNSGNALNGIVVAGKGIEKTNYTEPLIYPTPRIGVAYSPLGSQKFVIRGGVGMFVDRPQGDAVFGQLGNPPFAQQITAYYSSLPQVATGAAGAYQAPPNLTIFHYNASIPSSFQWNLGTQMLMPWNSSLDVSWVGIYNYNTIAYGTVGTTANQLPMDENAPDLGTAYLAKYQDPTLGTSSVPAATAVNTNLLRPYRGLGSITASWPYAWNRYDTIQISVNKQYSHGMTIGGNYTIGLRNIGNMLSPPHFDHPSDGSLQWSSLQPQLDSILHDVGTRRHTVKIFGMYQVPDLHVGGKVGPCWPAAGSFRARSPAEPGSPMMPRPRITAAVGTSTSRVLRPMPGASKSREYRLGLLRQSIPGVQHGRVRGPGYNSIGNESGSYLCAAAPTISSICRSAVISIWARKRAGCSSAPTPTTCSTM